MNKLQRRLILMLLILFSYKNSYSENLNNYDFLISDISFPISVGCDIEFGLSRVRDAIVLNRIKKNHPAQCNAFAFLVGNLKSQDKQQQIDNLKVQKLQVPDTIMPSLTLGGINVYLKLLLVNRFLWEKFSGYPSIIINGFYKQLNLLKQPYVGQLFGASLIIEIYKKYWIKTFIYPRFGLGFGILTAPISNIATPNINSHPISPKKIVLNGKGSPKKIFKGNTILLDYGVGCIYKVNNFVQLNTKIINQYMFSFPSSARYVVKSNNQIVKIKKNNSGDMVPKKSYMFFNNITFQLGIEYNFGESKTRYQTLNKEYKNHKLEFGTTFFMREINPKSFAENEALFGKIQILDTPGLQPNQQSVSPLSKTDDKVNLNTSSPGFGIFGIYSFKSVWLKNNFSSDIFDNINFILGSDLVFIDKLQYNKSKKLKSALLDTSRLSFLTGVGLFEDCLLSLRLLLGFDIISSDYWGEDINTKLIGSLYISPEFRISFFNKAALSVFTKIRPVKNIKNSYDLLFFETGVKLGVII